MEFFATDRERLAFLLETDAARASIDRLKSYKKNLALAAQAGMGDDVELPSRRNGFSVWGAKEFSADFVYISSTSNVPIHKCILSTGELPIQNVLSETRGIRAQPPGFPA
ncbi:MAG: hypothetical protein JRJ01_14685 [Deltaproteobacteria bacterium]|nr:hypothetical protein [Deltaproteobacteria bacterium]